jgi:hypothetical protein
MILPRWRAEYEMYITPHVRGDFVELKDVMQMLEDGKLLPDTVVGFTDYELGWNAGIEQLIQEIKKETK